MFVVAKNMLVGPNGRKRGYVLGWVIQDVESLDGPMGVIPNSSKLESKANLSVGSLDQGGSAIIRWVRKV